mgnify:CR=1 FL=1
MKRTTKINRKENDLILRLNDVRASWAVIFTRQRKDRLNKKSAKIAELFGVLAEKILKELIEAPTADHSRLYYVKDELNDSISCLNEIFFEAGQHNPFILLADAIVGSLSEILKPFKNQVSGEIENFYFAHAIRILTVFNQIIQEYLSSQEKPVGANNFLLSRLPPSFSDRFRLPENVANSHDAYLKDLVKLYEEQSDIFKIQRIFRHNDATFIPCIIGPVRKINDFYGYPTAKDLFKNHFEKFSMSGESLPLLISSLPGLGKTHFTISHTLHFENLCLILCQPSDLEKPLEKIIAELSLEKNRKFVLFFDDVDTRKIDWYFFRTNVGGTFVLPPNIAVVIASNFEFPANISSRGRCFTFPIFDEIRCQEMVFDFVLSLGVKNPKKELVSVIAADYVEEFGQHVFEELSPRTLVRYLERYKNDKEKRRKTLNMSKEKVIAVPDSAVFYEANQKVIERLNKSV